MTVWIVVDAFDRSIIGVFDEAGKAQECADAQGGGAYVDGWGVE